MSEEEKDQQVGRLALEYSRIKGELNHVEQRLGRAQRSYQQIHQCFTTLTVLNGVLACAANSQADLHGILGLKELVDAITERDRLKRELDLAAARLRAVAPHLV